MENFFVSYFQAILKAKPYSLYVLFVLLITFMLNQLDRFVLPITSTESAQDLKYGARSCLLLNNVSKSEVSSCSAAKNEDECNNVTLNGSEICKFDYNGLGIEYQIVSGPVFILVFTTAGIVVSSFADKFIRFRTYILAGSLLFWSLMTFLTGFVTEFWQLAVLRFGLGLGQAGCNPIATSIIADYFSTELRGSALSIYNWGIYVGYSLSFAIGSSILKTLDWRWVYRICGMPGFVVFFLIIFTIRNKKKESTQASSSGENSDAETRFVSQELTQGQKFSKVFREFLKPSVIMLCFAGSIRNAAGYVWAANNNQYYKLLGQTSAEISSYLGVIPIVFGIIGSFVGGFVSDRVSKKADPSKRIWVLVLSQIAAAPFAWAVLFFDPPYSYLFLIPTYIFGEMWIGVCLSVLVELVPEKLRTTGVGVYFFIISNIGGNMQVLVPPFKSLFQNSFGFSEVKALRGALYIFYPGEYIAGSLLFLLTLFVLKRDLIKFKRSASSSDEHIQENEAFSRRSEDEEYSY